MAQLHRRLRASAFGDLVGIASWLTSRGYPIRKSALGEYVRANRAAIEAGGRPGVKRQAIDAPGAVEVRLRCLEIAALTADAANAIPSAITYARWVLDAEDSSGSGR